MEQIYIEGSIKINGEKSLFSITNDSNEGWSQWGATQERLYDSVHIVDTLQEALITNVGVYSEEE